MISTPRREVLVGPNFEIAFLITFSCCRMLFSESSNCWR